MLPTNRVGRHLPWALLALTCAACGTAEFRCTAPVEPLSNFQRVKVSPFSVGLPRNQDPESLADAQKLAEDIVARLTHRLEKSRMFHQVGRTLTIQGRIVDFEPGSQALRYFVSFGAGAATMRVELTLVDEQGIQIAKGTATAEIWGGFFGGSQSSLGKRIADSVFSFLKENYKGIPGRVEPPPPTE